MANTRMTVHALEPVGGEVMGLPADGEIDAKTRAALYAAWLDYGILLFRDVQSAEQHLALSRCFGELEIHPLPEARWEHNPLFIELGGKKSGRAVVYDDKDLRILRIAWHRDTAYTPDICKGAMLRMLEVAKSEGETMLADTAEAYDDLPADVKARLEGLEYKATMRWSMVEQTRPGAFWKTARDATAEEDPQPLRQIDPSLASRYPSVIHPAMIVHPESGRRCIFISPTYVDYFIGMEQSESDELLRYLADHMTHPRYVYKHRWAVNDAIVWDNRRFMHAGMGIKPTDRRHGLRTTLAEQLRVGRYFDPSVTATGPALND